MIAYAFQLILGWNCHWHKESDCQRFKSQQSCDCFLLVFRVLALGAGESKAVEVCFCDQNFHEVLEFYVIFELLDSSVNHLNSLRVLKTSDGLEIEWLSWSDKVLGW